MPPVRPERCVARMVRLCCRAISSIRCGDDVSPVADHFDRDEARFADRRDAGEVALAGQREARHAGADRKHLAAMAETLHLAHLRRRGVDGAHPRVAMREAARLIAVAGLEAAGPIAESTIAGLVAEGAIARLGAEARRSARNSPDSIALGRSACGGPPGAVPKPGLVTAGAVRGFCARRAGSERRARNGGAAREDVWRAARALARRLHRPLRGLLLRAVILRRPCACDAPTEPKPMAASSSAAATVPARSPSARSPQPHGPAAASARSA